MLKAKFTETNVMNGHNYGNEKELVGAYTVIGKIGGEVREIVTARSYMGRSRSASVVYCSLWVSGAASLHVAAHGSAGGYGYHKESAALQDAISSAGIELYGSTYSNHYNYDEKRAYTAKELAAIARKEQKKRAHIGGVGSDAMRQALEAIARAAGARGKLIYVSH